MGSRAGDTARGRAQPGGRLRGVGLSRATSGDTDLLVESQTYTFTDNGQRRDGTPGGPAGYRSPDWHRTMIATSYFYKITLDGEVVGGLVLLRLGWDHLHLVRVWVDPPHQCQSIATRALVLAEAWHRHVTLWTVDAPAWAHRRRHFYKQNGYQQTHEAHGTVHYEKRRNGILRLRSLPDPTARAARHPAVREPSVRRAQPLGTRRADRLPDSHGQLRATWASM